MGLPHQFKNLEIIVSTIISKIIKTPHYNMPIDMKLKNLRIVTIRIY